MHHLGIGIAHRGNEILAVTDTSSVTVIELRTGKVLSVHDIDPARDYWRNKQRSPGRWPGLPVTYDATQMSHMSRLTTNVELRGFEPLTFCMPCSMVSSTSSC